VIYPDINIFFKNMLPRNFTPAISLLRRKWSFSRTMYLYSINGNDNSYITYQIWYVFGFLNHLRSSVGRKPKTYIIRITIAPIQPAKNTKLKINKSKYNTILMTRQKIHHMQLHAAFQMAFSPILLSLWNLVRIKKTKSRLRYKKLLDFLLLFIFMMILIY